MSMKKAPHWDFDVQASFSISSMVLILGYLCLDIIAVVSIVRHIKQTGFLLWFWAVMWWYFACAQQPCWHCSLPDSFSLDENVSPSFPVFNCLNHHHDFHFNTFMYCHQNGEVKKHTFNKFQPILPLWMIFFVCFSETKIYFTWHKELKFGTVQFTKKYARPFITAKT